MQGREGVLLAVGPAGRLGSICGQCFVLDPLTAGRAAAIGYALLLSPKQKQKQRILIPWVPPGAVPLACRDLSSNEEGSKLVVLELEERKAQEEHL